MWTLSSTLQHFASTPQVGSNRKLQKAALDVVMVRSWEIVSQQGFLVDLAHLILWHLLHKHQACGDGVGRHVFPAINSNVNTLMIVYCRKEMRTHTRNINAQGHTR